MNLKIVRFIDIYLGISLAYLIFFIKKISGRRSALPQAHYYGRILLVKFWGVGNVAMLLPAAKALKDKYPEAGIDFLTLLNNKDVSIASGFFRNIYTVNINSFFKFISSSMKNILELRAKNYDLIIDFEQFARFSAIFCSLIGRKGIIGFNTARQHRHFLYTKSAQYSNNAHITNSFYGLAELAGCAPENYIKAVPLACKQEDILKVEGVMRDYGIGWDELLVVLHAGTSENFKLRRWPEEYFAALADKLIDDFDARVIFTGLPGEVELVNRVMERLKNKGKALDLSGKLGFGEFISLIKLSDLVVSVDTAPVHLAASFSVATAGLYGPNTPLLYGPWGDRSIWFYKKLDCSPCITNYNAKINKCRHPQGQGSCMKQISADEVFLGIKKSFLDEDAKFRISKLNFYEQAIAIGKKYNG